MSIEEALRKTKTIFRTFPNTIAVARGIQKKDGQFTGEEVIIFFVTEKVEKSQLRIEELIPSHIKGINTDVQVQHLPRAPRHLVKPKKVDKTKRHRPCPCGVSIGHKDITAGSQGWYMEDLEGESIYTELCALSNNHVKANENLASIGDHILQPGPHDGGSPTYDQFETLKWFEPINLITESQCPTTGIVDLYNWLSRVLGRKTRLYSEVQITNLIDAALGEPINPDNYKLEIVDIGKPEGVEYDPPLMTIGLSSGRTSCLTKKAILKAKDWLGPVMYSRGLAYFDNQYVWEHKDGELFSQGGDSGKVILDHQRLLNSLLFAGSDTDSIANPIKFVEDITGLKMFIP